VGRPSDYIRIPDVRLESVLTVPSGASATVVSNVGEGEPMRIELALPAYPMAVVAMDTTLATTLGGVVVSSCPVLAEGTLDWGSRRKLTSFKMLGGDNGV
jgi:hypothetical protein